MVFIGLLVYWFENVKKTLEKQIKIPKTSENIKFSSDFYWFAIVFICWKLPIISTIIYKTRKEILSISIGVYNWLMAGFKTLCVELRNKQEEINQR